jgi:glycosyltransferase involved in cell wall biosynthesis
MANMSRPTQSVTLSMIVKNEAHVIERCLASVRPIITSWVVVDTGSTDGTQDIVRKVMADLPGALHERPWRDFAHNRTEALQLASEYGDYVLVIDADDTLEFKPNFKLPKLTADAYRFLIADAATNYYRTQLFRSSLDYRYEGVLHEVLVSSQPRTEQTLEGVVYRRRVEGARSRDPEKYRNDAKILEKALAENPTNARYAFYLAQSWRDAGEREKARDAYRVRAQMGGWDEEVWYSKFEIAKLTAALGAPAGEVIDAYLLAHEARRTRAESLCYLAQYLRERDRIVAAYPFARIAAETPRPNDRLFIDESVYAWRAADELAVAAYWTERFREALTLNERLLASKALPDSERARISANMAFAKKKLTKK